MEVLQLNPWTTDSVCPMCGNTFRHYKSQPQKHCSRTCARKSRPKKASPIVRCKKCDCRMPQQKYTNGRKRKFCSRWCANNRKH